MIEGIWVVRRCLPRMAVPEQVYVVTNRSELIAALNNGVVSSTSPANPSNESKVIYVKGTIDANVDDANQPLACTDYYSNGYTPEAFLATYDPAVWGRVNPSGPLESARAALSRRSMPKKISSSGHVSSGQSRFWKG